MKKIILILISILCYNLSSAQNFFELANYEFNAVESYKTQENNVITCANYILNTPNDKKNDKRLVASQFIMKWMTGTPDYTFEIGEKELELTKGNEALLMLYLASASKIVIEAKTSLSNDDIYNQAEKLIVDYCEDPKNKTKGSKKIKKILKSRS